VAIASDFVARSKDAAQLNQQQQQQLSSGLSQSAGETSISEQ
jgi:hypothetical protein